MLDQTTIRKYFHYDPITGDLYRKDRYINHTITGEYLSFKGKLYSTARIIFTYMSDIELPKVVLRVDRNPKNNKWNNFTTPVQISTNRVTGKPNMRPSAQKRPTRLSKTDIMEIFRWEQGNTNAEGDLYFIYQGANKLVTKTKITVRGVRYTRMYILKRVRQLTLGWDSMF